MKQLKVMLVLFLLVVTFVGATTLTGVSGAQIAEAADSSTDDFEVLAYEVQSLASLYSVDQHGEVLLDVQAAEKGGASKQSIKLALQIAEATNELVREAIANSPESSSGRVTWINVENVELDMSKYPELETFLAAATKRALEGAHVQMGSMSVYSVCGSYSNPRPTKAVAEREIGPYSTKSALETHLRNLKFYPVAPLPYLHRIGWTRDQTYQSAWCKWNTFRDNAWTPYQKSDGKWYIKLQDYPNCTGCIPGQPNPFMSVDKYYWPYPDWPFYVKWWHETY